MTIREVSSGFVDSTGKWHDSKHNALYHELANELRECSKLHSLEPYSITAFIVSYRDIVEELYKAIDGATQSEQNSIQ